MIRLNTILSILILFFLCSPRGIQGQGIENIGITKRLDGIGTIGDGLEIHILLDFVPRIIYDDHCFIGRYDQVIGYYFYTKIQKNISLLGEKYDLVEEQYKPDFEIKKDTLILFELDSNLEKRAVFQGVLKDSIYSGIWHSLKPVITYPFKIKLKSDWYSQLGFRSEYGNFVLNGNRSDFNQNIFKVIHEQFSHDTSYLFLKITEPCCGSYNCRGMDCGGSSTSLRIYICAPHAISYASEVIETQCDGLTDLEEEKIENGFYKAKRVVFKFLENQEPKPVFDEILVDFANLKKGFVISK